MTILANHYVNSVKNLEKAVKAVGMFLTEEEREILAYNIFFLKQQPQYISEVFATNVQK